MASDLQIRIAENLIEKLFDKIRQNIDLLNKYNEWIPGLSKPSSLNLLNLWTLLRDCNLRLSSILLTKFWVWCLLSLAKTLSWCASYSSRLGYIFDISISKLGSCRRLRFEISFFRQVGHSLLPLLRAVIMHSWQNLWRHSLVVIVHFNISKHMGHMSSLWRLRGETAISVASVITSWGLRCNSYKLSSHVFPVTTDSAFADNAFN